MNHKVTNLPKSEIEVEINLTPDEFEPHVKRAAVVISEETDIEGFRRGKAPFEKVKERVGEFKIFERAADLAIRKIHPDLMKTLFDEGAFSDAQPPIGKPEITVTKLAPGDNFQYKLKLSILPEVKLPDYKAIAQRTLKEKKDVAASDEEVTKAIDWVRESRAVHVRVDRAADQGDAVEVSFEIRSGGVKIDGGDSKNHPFVIGKGKFLPGFEEALVGMKAGDKKTFSLPVPDDWREKSVAGKILDVSAEMGLVEERRVPDLNDEFARLLGNFPDVEALKKNVRDGITQEKEEKEKQRIQALIIDTIADKCRMDIPEVLIEAEIDKMFAELKQGVESSGLTWETYLLHIKKTIDELKKDWRADGERRVRAALVLREIARTENVEPTEDEVTAEANKYLSRYKKVEDAEKDIDPASLREYIRGILKNQKVFQLLESA